MKKFKAPAPSPFFVVPWEYPGTDFNAAPDATVRVEIGGKKRSFLLKMRGERIFFKEPSRTQIYATTERLEEDLAGDTLIEKWEVALESDNYGVLVAKRDYFARLPVRAPFFYSHETSARLSRAGIEKWGENGRGNWAPQHARFSWDSASFVSAHDQLEGRLTLRDFLARLDTPEAAELMGKL